MNLRISTRTRPARISASKGIERQSVPLDARSLVALEFAAFWAEKHASVKVPAAVLIRRALTLFADHLGALQGPAINGEIHRIRDAGVGSGSALTLTQARARIEEHQRASAAQPMATWYDALRSKEENQAYRDTHNHLETVMAQQFPDWASS